MTSEKALLHEITNHKQLDAVEKIRCRLPVSITLRKREACCLLSLRLWRNIGDNEACPVLAEIFQVIRKNRIRSRSDTDPGAEVKHHH